MAVGLLVVAGIGAFLLLRSPDDTTPVSVSDAVSDFRDEPKRADRRPRHGPAPGVYRYATAGFELAGGTFRARHAYPPTSTVTVTERPCGVRERWDLLDERWSTVDTCVDARRTRVRSLVEYHEFFDRPQENAFSCTPIFAPHPRRMTVGSTSAGRCRSDDGDSIDVRVKVTELGDIEVAGEAVPAVRVRLTMVLRGSVRGANVVDSWLRRTDGLLLARIQRGDSEVDTPVGEAPYRERVQIKLRSLDPSR